MAKYEIKRTNICYTMGNETITDANDVFSFRADVEGSAKDYWCGFYDFLTEQYLVFPSGADEMSCLTLDADADENLGDFEAKLRNFIHDCCEDWVRLTKVADDCSCMEEMKWTPPKKVNGYGWDN